MSIAFEDIPEKMIPRRRVFNFTRGRLIHILKAHCLTEGISVSEDCKLNVTGLAVNFSAGQCVSLIVDGD